MEANIFLGMSAPEMRMNGVLVRVEVGLPNPVVRQLKQSGQAVPAGVEITAMVDTGASISGINIDVASRIGLIQTGSMPVGGVGGVNNQPVYAAGVRLPDYGAEWGAVQLIGTPLSGKFLFLVGRDLLCTMTLTYDGRSGSFSMSGRR